MKLYEHQEKVLKQIKGKKRVLLALEMGLGKSLCASEHLKTLDYQYCLIVCPKSLIPMWQEHYRKFYNQEINDFTKTKKIIEGINIVNYDLVFRRKELINIPRVTLILDEVNAIVNDRAKRTKAIRSMDIDNLIMLSGSIGRGKYENLYVLAKLLGALCTKKQFYDRYIIQRDLKIQGQNFPLKIVCGYKNIEELKSNMRKRNTIFLKTEQVLRLPEQTFIKNSINPSQDYKRFKKDRLLTLKLENGDIKELVGDCTLNRMLYERQLCGVYNKDKMIALNDLLESTDSRVIIFYNFWDEFYAIEKLVKSLDRPISVINGKVHDMENYDKYDNSVTLIQYIAGSSGINAQKANIIVYFSPTVSCDAWMQSKKRIHRINQTKPCFYYQLIVKNSIEEKIYESLAKGEDYTQKLFEEQNGTRKII